MSSVLQKWEPENPAFWNETGKSIANRNLWISIPCLLLAFAVWMVWSMVVVKLPDVIEALEKDGITPTGSTPAQFREVIAAETERWGRLVRETGIKLED